MATVDVEADAAPELVVDEEGDVLEAVQQVALLMPHLEAHRVVSLLQALCILSTHNSVSQTYYPVHSIG